MITNVPTVAYIRKENQIRIAAVRCARKGAKKMIKIEKVSIHGLEETIRGMRNPMNSWDKSDSGTCKGGDDGIGCKNCAKEASCEHTYDHSFQLGKADHELMMKLAAGGPVHAKYRRMITVYLDITAPLYWWKEFDTNGVSSVGGLSSFRTASLLPAMRKGMLNRNEETYFKRGVGGCDDGLFGRMWFGDTGR